MVNMSKRLAYEDSDDNDSSSEEDNGNFKRRRRHSSTADGEDFVTKTLNAFQEPPASKPVRGVTTRPDILIAKQKQADLKASKLITYDDIFDVSEPPDVTDSAKGVSKASVSKTQVSHISTTLEIADNDSKDEPKDSDDDIESVSEATEKSEASKTVDPRLKRLERFKPKTSTAQKSYTIPIKDRVNQMLNNRKPLEAYNALKGEISPLELFKYRDQLLVMAKDWFPSLIDTALDPRSIYIEQPILNSFQNIMKDLFNLKVKSFEFWDSILSSAEKFIRESRILALPQLLVKLQWIIVQDIREYMIQQSIKISIKNTEFLTDTRLKLSVNRERHRRMVEASVNQTLAKPTVPPKPVPVVPANPPPVVVPAIPTVPAIIGLPLNNNNDLIQDFELQIPDFELKSDTDMPSEPQSTAIPVISKGDQRTRDQIYECLINDQIIKFVNMLKRHTQNNDYTFIEYFGDTLRFFASNFPNKSIYDIYHKIHDFLKLQADQFQEHGLMVSDASKNKLKVIFEKLLDEFHQTLCYTPKEWFLIRDHSIREQCSQIPCHERHFHVETNRFNEPVIPILHNIIVDRTIKDRPQSQSNLQNKVKSLKPGVKSLKPGPKCSKPGPKSIKLGPNSVKALPKSTKPELKSTKAGPKSTKPGPKSMKPGFMSTKPGPKSTKVGPKSMKSGINSSEPEVKSSEPKVVSSEPEVEPEVADVQSTEPQVQPSEPKVQTTEPEVQTTEPEVQTTEPEVQLKEPEVQSTEREVECSEPEVQGLEPEIQFSGIKAKSSESPIISLKPIVDSHSSPLKPLTQNGIKTVSKTVSLNPPRMNGIRVEELKKIVRRVSLSSESEDED